MDWLSPDHPGYFDILRDRKAYTSLLYLLLSMAIGVFTFTYTVTGLSLSLGLAILILGLPVALAFLAGARLLSVGELWLLRTLVTEEGLPPVPPLLPPGPGWLARVGALVKDRRTWTSLLYFLLRLPLGVGYFALFTLLLTLGFALLAVPAAALLHGSGTLDLEGMVLDWHGPHPALALFLCGLAGAFLLPFALHLARALGRFQTWLACHLLVRPGSR